MMNRHNLAGSLNLASVQHKKRPEGPGNFREDRGVQVLRKVANYKKHE